MYFQLEEKNQALKKQIHGLKCKLGLDKQNADLLVEKNEREKGRLRKKLIILSVTLMQQSKKLQKFSKNSQTRTLKNASPR